MSWHKVKDICDSDDLTDLSKFFLTSIGPNGSVKLFQSPTGSITVTKTSNRILKALEFSNMMADTVSMAVKSFLSMHEDGGIVLGYLITQLTKILRECSLPEVDTYTPQLEESIKEVLKLALIKLDLSTTKDLLSMTKTVLSPSPWISSGFKDDLALTLLRGFLFILPSKDTDQKLNKSKVIDVQVVHGMKNTVGLHQNCLLYRYPELGIEDKWKFTEKFMDCPITVLALNLSITKTASDLELLKGIGNHRDDISTILQKAVRILCNFCVSHSVFLVINQKQFDEIWTREMERCGICVLERFGKSDIEILQDISGCKLISNLNFDERILEACLGRIKSAKHQILNDKSFLAFESIDDHETNRCTILIEHWNEEICEELKSVVNKALGKLFNIMRNPVAYPGGGCLEAILITHIVQKMGQEPKLGNFFKKCLTAFGKLAIAYKQNEEHEYSIDHQYGHLWLSDPSDNISNSCQCGLITKDECQERSLLSSLITGEIGSSKSHFEFQGKFKTCTDRKESVLLDDARMREVQFETAIEIASSLSMVKFVIEK